MGCVYGYGFDGGFHWMGLVGTGFMLLFWIGVAVLVIWVVTTLVSKNSGASAAVEILNRRFAGGEINQADYEAARKALHG